MTEPNRKAGAGGVPPFDPNGILDALLRNDASLLAERLPGVTAPEWRILRAIRPGLVAIFERELAEREKRESTP